MTSQIATFSDQNAAYSYDVDSQPDATFGQADTNDADLGSFFSRPLKIATFEWGVGNLLFERFNPWTLFFENPRCINRISNFSLLRAKLHMKIVLNGNGFHYGRALCSYNPLHSIDGFTVDRAFFQQDLIGASQRPHIYLDPTTSQGGDMTLPFFWYANALLIPDEEWRNMGECILQSMQNLKHANGATDRVTISVFAWAEDVSLSMPTSTDPGAISPQAGVETVGTKSKGSMSMKSDEYGEGVISKPASLVARVAGMLGKAPVIGPYAKATELAASSVSKIASLFGFSRPAVLEDIRPYKPTYLGNMANTNAADSVARLTMDAKQELTVDPRTVGLGPTDEMDVVSLAMRESYITQFPWTVDTVTETLLWNAAVTPNMWAENGISEPPELHMTPAAWVAAPFKFWRGSMKFRFQVVASNYHKGRIKVVYDPYYPITNEYNTNYTYILDIAENKDFTVTVGWGNSFAYCTKEQLGDSTIPYSTTLLPSLPLGSYNGFLSVYVVNELTIPNSTVNNDIAVNVFVSMCDDFEMGNPTGLDIDAMSWFPYDIVPAALQAEGAESEPEEWPLGLLDLQARKEDIALGKKKEEALQAQQRVDDVIRVLGDKLDMYDEVTGKKKPDKELEPQSGVEETAQADSENTPNPSAPMAMESDADMAPNLDRTDGAASIFLGEEITSIRQILKRYCFHSNQGQRAGGKKFYKLRDNNLPFYRGFVVGGVHSATAPGSVSSRPYNRVKMTLMNWYIPAFKGWRGSTRWKIHTAGYTTATNNGSLDKNYMKVRRVATELFTYNSSVPDWIDFGTANNIAIGNMFSKDSTIDGGVVTYEDGNGALEYELPYQEQLRFLSAKEQNLTTNFAFTAFHDFETVTNVNSASGVNWDKYCATGEDFSLFFFTGAPIAFRIGYGDPPL